MVLADDKGAFTAPISFTPKPPFDSEIPMNAMRLISSARSLKRIYLLVLTQPT